jgi:cytochrome c
MKHYAGYPAAALVLLVLTSLASAQSGDPPRGAGIFRACAPCHSLETDRNMTGPSLADLWNRKAGGLSSFTRYSPPLRSAGVVWDDKTLDEWVKDKARRVLQKWPVETARA